MNSKKGSIADTTDQVLPQEVPQRLKAVFSFWRETASEEVSALREAHLYSQKAGPYRTADDPQILLTETVEEIVANEHQSWRSLRERSRASSAPIKSK
jgi:hypothetical protein